MGKKPAWVLGFTIYEAGFVLTTFYVLSRFRPPNAFNFLRSFGGDAGRRLGGLWGRVRMWASSPVAFPGVPLGPPHAGQSRRDSEGVEWRGYPQTFGGVTQPSLDF